MVDGQPRLRLATPADERELDELMKVSAAALFPRFYDERQAASAVRYVPEVDPILLSDGTYFVLESGREPVACGGWSRRDRLHAEAAAPTVTCDCWIRPPSPRGSARCSCAATGRAAVSAGASSRSASTRPAARGSRGSCSMATLPGVPLYRAYGFEPLEELEITLPDGVTLPCVSMSMSIARSPARAARGARPRRRAVRYPCRSFSASICGSRSSFAVRSVRTPCCLRPRDLRALDRARDAAAAGVAPRAR